MRLTLEQIDLIRNMCASYSELELVTSVKVKWTYPGYWGMNEATTLALENNHLTYACSSEQHSEAGLPHWCGGWTLDRQQPRCASKFLPAGGALPDAHSHLQHTLVSTEPSKAEICPGGQRPRFALVF